MKIIELENGHLYYQESGTGQTILWIHGLPLNSDSWFAQFEYFKSDYHNIAIDLRGYGKSSALPKHFDSITDLYVSDIKQCIKKLKLNKPILVGFASGGHAALNFAAKHSNMIGKLIVINASPCFKKQKDWQWGFSDESLADFTQKIKATSTYEELANILYIPAIKEKNSSQLKEMKSWFIKMLIAARKEAILAFFNNIAFDDNRDLLNNINAPTLIINSVLDEEVPVEVGLYLRKNIISSQYCEINGIDHFAFATQSELVNSIIEQFISPITFICTPIFNKEDK